MAIRLCANVFRLNWGIIAMVAKRCLRSVKPNEAPPANRRPKTIVQAVTTGDRRALLVALQKVIATTVADPGACRPRELAELTRQLRDIAREIEDIDAEHEAASNEHEAPGGESEPWDITNV
jgi:hypothetical protein